MTRVSRSGQAALEFLITYGWAILALLVAIGAITYFTDGFGAWAPDLCSVDPPFACLEQRVAQDGTVLLGIHNSAFELAAATITLTCDARPPIDAIATIGNTPVSARFNGTFVRFACPPASGRFDARFTISYQARGEGTTHEAAGEISTHVEP